MLYSAVLFFGKSSAPKLGLDLQGGTSQTLSANAVAGGAPVNSENLGIARDIISQRVDSLGVAEAEVVVQGHDIVVNMPGKVDPSKLSSLSTQAKLEFRTVLQAVPDVPATPAASPSASTSPSAAPSTSPSGAPAAKSSATPNSTPSSTPSAAPSTSAPAVGPAAPSASPSASSTAAPDTAAQGQGISTLADVKAKVGPTAYAAAEAVAAPLTSNPTTAPTQPTAAQAAELAVFGPVGKGLPGKLTPADVAALPPTIQYAVPNITCAQLNGRVPGVITTPTAVNSEVVSCDPNGTSGGSKYLLDAAKVHGEDVSGASANLDTGGQGQPALGWVVNLSFKGAGQAAWTNLTKELYNASDAASGNYRQVAIVLDNTVVTAPQIENVIPGPATISGGTLDQDTAKLLATQLKFGALPISFTPQQTQTVSASLGLAQLKAGLLAGGIGLALVILYCLFYYRGLGLVVIASLAVSASLIYAAIVLLGRSQLSFTLSLAGVAGFIVAIGITADSFVVFFERLKDEVRDGRSGRSAVPKAWTRARRTILSADAVSFIAAVSLVIFATGPVSGFAFTLGLSTIIDLVVVFMFTHPLVALLSGSKAFTSPRFSGLGDMRTVRRTEPGAPRLATKES
ncbi:MAG TPA: protein translocase subunit SecD [Micromonosporaceae bacterium]